MSNFTQETFNQDHAEPRDYGEGDYYVVGNNYTDAEAARVIGEWETSLTGEQHSYKAEDIVAVKAFVSRHPDDGDDDWAIRPHSEAEPIAWGKAVQL